MFSAAYSSPSHERTSPPRPNPDPRLPRGECRFILLHPSSTEKRCSCQGFWLNNALPVGSACECGHQACYHESVLPRGCSLDEPSVPGPSEADFNRLLQRVARLEHELGQECKPTEGALHGKIRELEEALEMEKLSREQEVRNIYRAVEGIYYNLGVAQKGALDRLVAVDDKVEGVWDRVCGVEMETKMLEGRVEGLEERGMSMEDRFDALRGGSLTPEFRDASEGRADTGRRASPRGTATMMEDLAADGEDRRRPLTPFTVLATEASPGPISLHEAAVVVEPPSWTLLVCFSHPSPSAPSIKEAYYRPPLRQKQLTLYGSSPASVSVAIETFFSDLILPGQSWMPLLRPTHSERHGMSIPRPLPQRQQQERDMWDVKFLQTACSIRALSKGSRTAQDTLFITSCPIPAAHQVMEMANGKSVKEEPPVSNVTDNEGETRPKRCLLKRTLSCTSHSEPSTTATNATTTPATSTSNLGPIAIHTANHAERSPKKRFKLRRSIPIPLPEGAVHGLTGKDPAGVRLPRAVS